MSSLEQAVDRLRRAVDWQTDVIRNAADPNYQPTPPTPVYVYLIFGVVVYVIGWAFLGLYRLFGGDVLMRVANIAFWPCVAWFVYHRWVHLPRKHAAQTRAHREHEAAQAAEVRAQYEASRRLQAELHHGTLQAELIHGTLEYTADERLRVPGPQRPE